MGRINFLGAAAILAALVRKALQKVVIAIERHYEQRADEGRRVWGWPKDGSKQP